LVFHCPMTQPVTQRRLRAGKGGYVM
jgi:hypothetical protein